MENDSTYKHLFKQLAYIFSVNFVFEKNENKQKEAGVGQFFKTTCL